MAPKVEQAKEEMKRQFGQVIQESAKDGGKKLWEKLKIPISMGEAKPAPDIPTYPKGEVAHSYRFGVKGNEANLVHMAIPDPPDMVARFYRENLPSRGWKLDQKSSKDGNETVSFSKGKRYVYLVASPDSEGASLLLVWTEGINPREFLEKGK
ncbi:MAG: hypothetical protein HYU64_05790 [Armatimonadetes bacterium]|nr:hypothetical protein [Armatimonadota bacterium]